MLVEQLSKRELEVLQALSLGTSYEEVAGKLGISTNTVKHHVSVIYTKLQAKNRIQAINRAYTEGLIAR